MGLFEGGVILRLVGVMEAERNAIVCITAPDELDDGMREKLSVSPKAKRVASPRWSKHETLVMIEAKRKHELDIQQANGLKGRTQLTDVNKWDLVSASCRAVGIDRDGKMCRKRWFNLLTEFKKILEWCKTNGFEDFWNMSGDERREKKLPTGFDQEIYLAMESFSKSPSGMLPDESGSRGATDDGMFLEIGQDVQPAEDAQHLENGTMPVELGAGNGLRIPSVVPEPLISRGMSPERPRNLKKRKLPCGPVPGEADPKDPYIAILENTSKSLQAAFTETIQAQLKVYSRTVHAQIEAQKQENALERALRKEQGDKLIGVLTTLVDALSKIADKL